MSCFFKPPWLFQIPMTDLFFTDYSLVKQRMGVFSSYLPGVPAKQDLALAGIFAQN